MELKEIRKKYFEALLTEILFHKSDSFRKQTTKHKDKCRKIKNSSLRTE